MNHKVKIILAVGLLVLLALYSTIKFQGSEEPPAAVPASSQPAPPVASARPVAKPPVQVAAPAASPVAVVNPPVASPAPVSAPAPVLAPAPTAAPSPLADPRLDVSTAMKGFVDLLESGDYVTAADTYLQLPPNISGAQVMDAMRQNPDFPNTVQMMINATKAAQTGIPTYDETGNLATYQLSQPTNGKTMVRWKKVNGLWYVDAFE